ncbi:Flp family type IVb pilin [Altererythrobacter sp. KTW20L]|uniref:Flp family type IVb pilin n=1 Tax=Altererythrobacter sp. KTW20L TaxID=2942210 RepID=UPI0020BF7F19|nr:Flp family type IVb pilin [Altererythrobacter sp. KTW20L]MCL6251353.1 Flp family type IVb pilin [Altererythrobacter sp. KTW20L]
MSGIAIIKSLLRDESGATAIEYGLIASLIVIAMMGALSTFANEANDMFDDIETNVQNARDL